MSDLYTAPALLHWDEPDIGCVSCGETHTTIDDHRCGSCIDAPVHYCPLCLGDIGDLIGRELVRRLRTASNDVAAAYVDGNYLTRMNDRQRAAQARAAMLGRAS